MRCINPRFTYLLTYLLTRTFHDVVLTNFATQARTSAETSKNHRNDAFANFAATHERIKKTVQSRSPAVAGMADRPYCPIADDLSKRCDALI